MIYSLRRLLECTSVTMLRVEWDRIFDFLVSCSLKLRRPEATRPGCSFLVASTVTLIQIT